MNSRWRISENSEEVELKYSGSAAYALAATEEIDADPKTQHRKNAEEEDRNSLRKPGILGIVEKQSYKARKLAKGFI